MKKNTLLIKCDCPWCGGVMERNNCTYMHKKIKHYTFWCRYCGAVMINAKSQSSPISGFSIKFDTEDKKEYKLTRKKIKGVKHLS